MTIHCSHHTLGQIKKINDISITDVRFFLIQINLKVKELPGKVFHMILFSLYKRYGSW